MSLNEEYCKLSQLDKYNFEKLLFSRRKLLSLSLLFFIPMLILLISYLTLNVGVHFTTYGIISLIYFLFYKLWNRNVFLTLLSSTLFMLFILI